MKSVIVMSYRAMPIDRERSSDLCSDKFLPLCYVVEGKRKEFWCTSDQNRQTDGQSELYGLREDLGLRNYTKQKIFFLKIKNCVVVNIKVKKIN